MAVVNLMIINNLQIIPHRTNYLKVQIQFQIQERMMMHKANYRINSRRKSQMSLVLSPIRSLQTLCKILILNMLKKLKRRLRNHLIQINKKKIRINKKTKIRIKYLRRIKNQHHKEGQLQIKLLNKTKAKIRNHEAALKIKVRMKNQKRLIQQAKIWGITMI